MSIGPADERLHADAATSAVTFGWGDLAGEHHGVVRLGLSGDGGARRASVLALVFAGSTPVGALARGDLEVGADADWGRLELPGITAATVAPLGRWTLELATEEARVSLVFTATSPPAELAAKHPVAELGGMRHYEQLCRVDGEVVVGDAAHRLDGVPGQRGHAWGAPDWEALGETHSVAAWLRPGTGIALTALHPADAEGHEDDPRWAVLPGPDVAAPVADARLSTTLDEDGRQRRLGLELWVGEGEDERAHRAAATVLCGSTLELGQLRLDCAFLRWTMNGEVGVGRSDLLRRAD